jgi:hypothetical protein
MSFTFRIRDVHHSPCRSDKRRMKVRCQANVTSQRSSIQKARLTYARIQRQRCLGVPVSCAIQVVSGSLGAPVSMILSGSGLPGKVRRNWWISSTSLPRQRRTMLIPSRRNDMCWSPLCWTNQTMNQRSYARVPGRNGGVERCVRSVRNEWLAIGLQWRATTLTSIWSKHKAVFASDRFRASSLLPTPA